MKTKIKTIAISPETYKRVMALKQYERETADQTISRLLSYANSSASSPQDLSNHLLKDSKSKAKAKVLLVATPTEVLPQTKQPEVEQ